MALIYVPLIGFVISLVRGNDLSLRMKNVVGGEAWNVLLVCETFRIFLALNVYDTPDILLTIDYFMNFVENLNIYIF